MKTKPKPKPLSRQKKQADTVPKKTQSPQAIDKRKLEEKELSESEKLYRALFAGIPDGIIIHDADGLILKANEAIAQRLEIPLESLPGRHITEFITPDNAANVGDNARTTLSGQSQVFQTTYVSTSGNKIPAEVHERQIQWGNKQAVLSISRDITKRKQTENALSESEKKYRGIFENSVTGLFKTTPKGSLIDANDAFARMYGYSGATELLAANIDVTMQLYATPKERKKVLHILAEKGKIENHETMHLKQDGTIFWVSITARTIRDTDGNALYYEGTMIDITERKLMEEKLRREEQRFRALAEQSSDIIVLVNREGIITYENSAVEKILGLNAAERIGVSIFEHLHPDDFKLVADAFDKLFKDKNAPVQQAEIRLQHRNGSWRKFETVGSNLINDNVIEAVIVNLHDITERKKAEEVLKETELKFRTIFNSASDGIILLSVGDGKFSDANKIMCNLLGYKKEELLKLSIQDLHPQKSVPFIIDQYEKLMKKEILIAKNIPVIKKDKTMFFADISGSKIFLGEKEFSVGVFRDITERKKVEEALKRSEDDYRSLFEQSLDGVIIIGPSGIIIANQAFCVLSGYPIEKVIGENPLDFIHPDDREIAAQRMAKIQSGKQFSEDYIYRAFRADGSLSLIDLRSKLIEWEGKPAFQTIVRDVTERKQAEEALRAGEERYRHITNCIPDLIWMMDLSSGRFTYVNSAVERILGWTVEEYQQCTVEDVVTPRQAVIDRAMIEEDLTKAASPQYDRNTIHTWESEELRKDGSTFTAEVSAAFLWSEDGKPVGIIGTSRDITERKKAETSLRISEEKYRGIFDESIAAVYVFDAKKNFINTNQAGIDLLGYSREQLLQMNIADVDSDPSVVLSAHQELLAGDRIINYEHKLKRNDDTIVTVLNNSRPLTDIQGNVIGMLSTLIDITDRKRTEAYLKISTEILHKLNEPGDLHDAIQHVIATLKTMTGFDAVGIRLQDGDDFPYFLQDGFSKDFLLTENTLIERASDGGVCRDKDGNIKLECTCGLVISGKTDPANPLFTQRGSAWTNDSFPFLDLPSDGDPRLNPRNQCIHQGYASIALIPIRSNNRIVGLIHLNDRHKGCFTRTTVEFLENIASYIGSTLMRKKAEEERQKEFFRLQSMVSNAPVVLFAVDKNGVFTLSEGKALLMMGLKGGEVVGRSAFDVYRDMPDDQEHFRRALKGEAFTTLVKAGDHFFEAYHEPVVTKDGKFDGSSGILVDVTERTKAEEKLKQSLLLNEAVLKSVPGLLYLYDDTGHLLHWNKQHEDLTGYSGEEIRGRYIMDWFGNVEPDTSIIKKGIDDVMTNGYGTAEARLMTKDGKFIPMYFTGVKLNISGKDHLLGIGTDITERKQAEEELKKYREHLEELVRERTINLESSNKELEAFSYSASHDLRAPLRTIDGFSQALLEDCGNKLDIQGKDYLIRIRAAAQHMALLIEDMMQLSRITRTELNIEKVNLTSIARSVIAELQNSQPKRHVEIIIADGLEDKADSRLIRLVLENLLGNAWKFTGKQSESLIEFGSMKKDEKKVYFIRDNGAGFDMAYVDKLFAPFQRLHTEEEFSGTGIGLATVRRIIHRHGGNVWAEGQTGKGATFCFSLNER